MGGGFAHAIGSDGKLYGWGLDDTGGQVGDGDDGGGNRQPIVVSLAAGVTPQAIAATSTRVDVGSNGEVYVWGSARMASSATAAMLTSAGRWWSAPKREHRQEPRSRTRPSAGYAVVDVSDSAPSIATNPTSQSVSVGQNRPSPPGRAAIHSDGAVAARPMVGELLAGVGSNG